MAVAALQKKRRRKKKSDEEPRRWKGLVVVFLLVATPLFFCSVLLMRRHVIAKKEETSYLFSVVGVGGDDPKRFDRAVAWCSRLWDLESSKVAEAAMARVDASSDAATTVANLLVRAVEEDMRTSGTHVRYEEVLSSAFGLLVAAAKKDNHRGAHYSLALLLKLYPNLLKARGNRFTEAAAAHLCASRKASINHVLKSTTCTDLRDDEDLVETSEIARREEDVALLVSLRAQPNSWVTIEGLDAIVHDIPSTPEKRSCRIYDLQGSGCYAALWRQFGTTKERQQFQSLGLVDGFSGGAYYHWLLQGLPRLLFLSDALQEKIPVFLPSQAPSRFIEETLELLPSAVFRHFSALHFRRPGVALDAKNIISVRLHETAGGDAAVLYPSKLAVDRLRRAFQSDSSEKRNLSTLLFIVRAATEARAFGNREAVTASLAGVAASRGLQFVLFDGNTFSMKATIDIFQSAKLVVGVHGAGLANIVFCHRDAAVLELALPEPEFREYEVLAQHLSLSYAAFYLPPSNFEARVFPRPSLVAQAADALLSNKEGKKTRPTNEEVVVVHEEEEKTQRSLHSTKEEAPV